MNHFEQLRKHWTDASIPVVDPATPDEVDGFEKRHGIELPSDFKDYLLIAGGMPEGRTDDDMLEFASLETLNNENRWTSPDSTRKMRTFADYLIFSHWYLIDLGHNSDRGAVFATHDGDEFVKLAPTFKEFIEAYLADPERVAYFWTADATAK
jgi:hypothetical protein